MEAGKVAEVHRTGPEERQQDPILGAFAVNGAKSWFTVAYPEYWLYFLGLLFVLVTLLLPRGLLGLGQSLTQRWRRVLTGAATAGSAATNTEINTAAPGATAVADDGTAPRATAAIAGEARS